MYIIYIYVLTYLLMMSRVAMVCMYICMYAHGVEHVRTRHKYIHIYVLMYMYIYIYTQMNIYMYLYI